MVAGSILPIAIHNNKIFFLFGKEKSNDDTPGWSDFGGGVENNETPLETALREGGEELTGFLGDSAELKKYKIVHKILWGTYHLHIILINYDKYLPNYYNNSHNFLWKRMNNTLLEKTKLFEKVKIEWFSPSQMRTRRNQFRSFYRNVVDIILKEIPIIKQKLNIKKNNTRSITPSVKKNVTSHIFRMDKSPTKKFWDALRPYKNLSGRCNRSSKPRHCKSCKNHR